MKTAMQELFLALHNTHPEQWIDLLMHDEKILIEKEKQQIIDTYKDFDHDMTAEQYYNETFKND